MVPVCTDKMELPKYIELKSFHNEIRIFCFINNLLWGLGRLDKNETSILWVLG